MTDETITVDDVVWTRSPQGRKLLAPDQLRFTNHHETCTTIKHGAHRTVYRVTLDNRTTIYWKHCRLNGSRAWWREVLRGPKALLEWRKINQLAQRGIASIEPLAWGRFVGRWPRGSFLITRELADARPLDEWLQANPFTTNTHRRLFAEQLAHWVAKVHEAGVLHPDFHPGNILVRQADDQWHFFLIDVHDVELYAKLTLGQREQNLMLINRWFQLRTNRTDRLRFWRAYRAHATETPSATAIEERTNRSNVALWLARDQRCTRTNREFVAIRHGSYRGFALAGLSAESAAMIQQPDEPLTNNNNRVLKSGRTAGVVELPSERPLIYKLFRLKEWYAPLVNMVRPSPTLRSWWNGHALRGRQLPTPTPLLMFHRYRWFPCEGYVLWNKIVGSQHLHEVVTKQTFSQRRELIDQLARLIRLMHERCLSHRDLKPANILIDEQGAIFFIDLVGVKTHRTLSDHRRQRDLVRLNAGFLNQSLITHRDRLRFLRMYLCWALRGHRDWKDWWRAIAAGTAAKVRQNARRKRPLA